MPELTGGQITLKGNRACPYVENLRELGENCVSVGGDILLQGEFSKMDQRLAILNSSIALKANQSDMNELEATLNTKANRSDSGTIRAMLGINGSNSGKTPTQGYTKLAQVVVVW